MALIRALNSAISGLRAQQVKVDVIGDNLANSTTPGFKETRLLFKTVLSQTISYGTAPQGFLGGIDPVQYGLGVQVGDTSKNWNQGALAATGITSDLAIQGDGFFIMLDETGAPVYSRDGSFTVNPANLLHDPSTGYIVQGWNAEYTNFTITPGAAVEDVSIPIGVLRIARETDNAIFDGNLNGNGAVANSGSVLETSQFRDTSTVLPATLSTQLVNLADQTGTSLGLGLGDVITFDAKKGGRALPTLTFEIASPPSGAADDAGTTLGDLIDFLEDALGVNNTGSPTSNQDWMYSDLVHARTLTGFNAATLTLTDTSTNFVTEGVEVGDYVRFTSGNGAGQIAQVTAIQWSGGPTPNDQLVLNAIDPTFLPTAGTTYEVNERARVALGTGGAAPTDPRQDARAASGNITAGAVRIMGNAGAANAISEMELVVNGQRIGVFQSLVDAAGESVLSNATFYDSLGNAHLVEVTFVREAALDDVNVSDRGNVFRWFAECADQTGVDRIVGTGTITFYRNGQYYGSSADQVSVNLNYQAVQSPLVVSPDFSALTGFANRVSDVAMTDQDGFAQGTLQDYAVGMDGVITGIFSNGITRPIAEVALARFPNNNGLMQEGSNIYRVGANSGQAEVGVPGSFARGTIVSGYLEESNVDLARQFTELIVGQRAFQANARTITTANDMLQELVNIV